jgi:hypothetical protein
MMMFQKGHIPWSAGKCHSGETGRKIGNAGRGRVVSKETRQKISIALLGARNPNYDKSLSDEHRQRLREAHLGARDHMFGGHLVEATKQKLREANLGSKNPNWRGGSSFLPYPPEFDDELKLQIKERDDFTCQVCGLSDVTLQVHHIDWNKNNNDPGNLITLCPSCHGKLHKILRRAA